MSFVFTIACGDRTTRSPVDAPGPVPRWCASGPTQSNPLPPHKLHQSTKMLSSSENALAHSFLLDARSTLSSSSDAHRHKMVSASALTRTQKVADTEISEQKRKGAEGIKAMAIVRYPTYGIRPRLPRGPGKRQRKQSEEAARKLIPKRTRRALQRRSHTSRRGRNGTGQVWRDSSSYRSRNRS